MKKKALLTGASRGIGEATAEMLAIEGCDLYLVCRSSGEKLEAVKNRLESKYGIACQTFLTDISDPDRIEALFQNPALGNVDYLINNAAISHVGLMTDMTVEQWQTVIATNLNSLFYICRQVVPGMVHRKAGKIINISSVWGSAGASMEVAYSAAKGGVNSFTRALAKELAPSHIQVNAVAFGLIDTDMNALLTEEEKKALTEEIPADRMGTAGEAAQMIRQVLYAPEYLTGQIITMDGGWI